MALPHRRHAPARWRLSRRIPIVWRGSSVEEKGIEKSTGKVLVEVDDALPEKSPVNAGAGHSR